MLKQLGLIDTRSNKRQKPVRQRTLLRKLKRKGIDPSSIKREQAPVKKQKKALPKPRPTPAEEQETPVVLTPEQRELLYLEKKLGIRSGGKKKDPAHRLKKELRRDGLDELQDLWNIFETAGSLAQFGQDEEDEWQQEEEEEEEWQQQEHKSDDEIELVNHRNSESVSSGEEEMPRKKPKHGKRVSSSDTTEVIPYQEEKAEQAQEEEDKQAQDEINTTGGIFGFNDTSYGDAERKPEWMKTENAKYVPPHLRAQSSQQSLNRLTRKLTGSLNKLSPQNLQPVLTELKQTLSSLPKQESSKAFTQALMQLLRQETRVVANVLTSAASVLTVLHFTFWENLGAFVLEDICKLFVKCHADGDFSTADVVVQFISSIFLFQLINAGLVFDFLNFTSKELSAANVSLILSILKICGFQLRKDDPARLKEWIIDLQSQLSQRPSTPSSDDELRIEFMMESITDLKNNKMHKHQQEQIEMFQPIRKQTANLIAQAKIAHAQTAQVSFSDFLAAEEKGRWWIVGSAWKSSGSESSAGFQSKAKGVVTDQLLALAKQCKMNTELKQSVFCIVMGSEDYIDAFEKLTKLNLKARQDGDVVRIIIDCCGREAAFNPYYAHLLEQLCSFHRKFKFSLQLAFWDIFQALNDNSMSKRRVSNIAMLLAAIIAGQKLPIVMLKVVDFQSLKSNDLLFFFLFFVELVKLCGGTDAIVQVFQPLIDKKDSLKALIAAMLFFFEKFVLTKSNPHLSDCEFVFSLLQNMLHS